MNDAFKDAAKRAQERMHQPAMTDAIDWVAKAKLIGSWEYTASLHEGRLHYFADWYVLGWGATEQLAARDAVLRLRELCKVVNPEAGAVIEAARAWRDDGDADEGDLFDALAALDAKERAHE